MKKYEPRTHSIKFSPEDTPGVICIERRVQNDAILISGTLKLGYNSRQLDIWVDEAIKKAASDAKKRGGVMGQIKAAIMKTSEDVLALVDDDTTENESSRSFSRISIACVILMDDPKEAENIIRTALADIRAKVREA